MPKKDAKNKKDAKDKNLSVLKNTQDNQCPQKEGDNCLVPGIYSDSDPIGGGG
ncbi:MAG: hypothetical protein ABFD08_16170 [Syntrophomonas sp.]